jgi:nicotinamide-nucleotide amidase
VDVILITVGDEVLRGYTLDLNAHWLTRVLTDAGHRVLRRTTVPDAADAIGAALDDARRAAGLVILTGGLGGTPDDRTLDVVSGHLGLAVEDDLELRDALEAEVRLRGGQRTQAVRRIARRIQGADRLTNPVGQAPGVWIADGETIVVLLPGVPSEVRGIAESSLLPRLGQGEVEVITRRTVGIGEGALAERLRARGLPEEVAFLPWMGGVDLHLTSPRRGRWPEPVRRAVALIEEVAGDGLLGDATVRLEVRVGDLLRRREETVAVGESLTGGGIGAALTSVPGASDYFLASTVAYANAAKVTALKVRPETIESWGAVSAEVAAEMALGARERAGADWGLSTTGVAGPDGGSDEKPVGLVYLGLALPDGETVTWHRRYPGDRAHITALAVAGALDLLRRGLEGRSLEAPR